MEKNFLAIDMGASSCRGVLGSYDGKKLRISKCDRIANSYITRNGSYFWDIDRLYLNIKNIITKSVTSIYKESAPESIGIDSWGVDYGAVDRNGMLLWMPYSYRDYRICDTPQKVHHKFSWEQYYALTGVQLIASNTIYQLYEDLVSDPKTTDKVESILLIPDLIQYFLTGIKSCEYTIMSTSGLLNVQKKDLAGELLTTLNISSKIFSPIMMPGTSLGKISDIVAKEMGIKSLSLVRVAEHDTASAVSAVPWDTPDHIYISSGTWSLLGTISDVPVINEKAKLYNFTNEGGAFQNYRLLKNLTGLGLLNEAGRQWTKKGIKYDYNDYLRLSDPCTKFEFFVDLNDPRFIRPGNVPELVCEYCRDSGQKEPTSIGEIVRCIYDNIALSYRDSINMLTEITNKTFRCIHIVGGGACNKALCQLTADVTGLPVYTGPVEASAVGNLLMQAYACGEIRSEDEIRRIISTSFVIERYEPDRCMERVVESAYGNYKRVLNEYIRERKEK